MNALYFLVKADKASDAAQMFYSNLKIDAVKEIFELAGQGVAKQISKLVLNSVKMHELIKIRPSGIRIIKELMLEEIANGTINKINAKPYEMTTAMLRTYDVDHEIPIRIISDIKLPLDPNNPKNPRGFIFHIHGGGFVALCTATQQPFTRM